MQCGCGTLPRFYVWGPITTQHKSHVMCGTNHNAAQKSRDVWGPITTQHTRNVIYTFIVKLNPILVFYCCVVQFYSTSILVVTYGGNISEALVLCPAIYAEYI